MIYSRDIPFCSETLDTKMFEGTFNCFDAVSKTPVSSLGYVSLLGNGIKMSRLNHSNTISNFKPFIEKLPNKITQEALLSHTM